jgi:hypothetical protein
MRMGNFPQRERAKEAKERYAKKQEDARGMKEPTKRGREAAGAGRCGTAITSRREPRE